MLEQRTKTTLILAIVALTVALVASLLDGERRAAGAGDFPPMSATFGAETVTPTPTIPLAVTLRPWPSVTPRHIFVPIIRGNK